MERRRKANDGERVGISTSSLGVLPMTNFMVKSLFSGRKRRHLMLRGSPLLDGVILTVRVMDRQLAAPDSAKNRIKILWKELSRLKYWTVNT